MGAHTFDATANHRVRVDTRHWPTIDGMPDNEGRSRQERGDHHGAELAHGVRRAGRDQVPDWPRDAAGFATWPAPGQTSTLVLNAARWALVVSGLDRWADIGDSLGIPEHAVMANEERNIAALIRARLAEQGWASPE